MQVAGGFRPRIPADVPEAVRALIVACWAQEPCDRPTALEVKKALEVRVSSCSCTAVLCFVWARPLVQAIYDYVLTCATAQLSSPCLAVLHQRREVGQG